MSAATICPPNIEAPAEALGLLTVDLAALAENWRRLSAVAGPAATVAAVVKADGYGLGMMPVARSLARAGCRWFFVAVPDEALLLAGALAPWPDARIAVLSGPLPGTLKLFRAHEALIPVLNDRDQLAAWQGSARPAMLNFDTGMARLGLAPDDSVAVDFPLAAITSHLACADQADNPLNPAQLARFERLTARFPGIPRSLAASFGLFLGASYRFELIRAGAALYGLNPTPSAPNPMRQVVGLQARILQVREIDRGMTVGYGATFTADRRLRVATLGVGYADGLPRSAGNRVRCHIGPLEVPVIGRISMDLTTVDISAVPQARPGDLVELAGAHYGIDALAADCGTLGYEILTGLGPRLHRVYLGAA